MDRRTFLQVVGITAGCVIAGGVIGGYSFANRLGQDPLDALKTEFAEMLTRRYGECQGEELGEKINQELKTAMSQLPNVGTIAENKWASNMPPAALALAAYRVLVPNHATLDELGEMFYRTVENQIRGLPALILRATYSESVEIERARQPSTFFQQRKYPDNWVTIFMPGDNQDFAYGLDVTECAIVKYHRAQGAPELSRYLCLMDNITMGAQGRGLVRSRTLAEGCDKCDFRFKQGRPNDVAPLRGGWPPRFNGS